MPSNVVVSERLLKSIAKRYVQLQRSGNSAEADKMIDRLDPTEEFVDLIKKQIVKEVANR